ncbi:Sulfite reductase [Cupriavidus necator]|uniref:flavodoxin domain-containing protein n=1 Tax=Cupriavidus necator TaxID=106590 RepID=UPI003F73BDD8
MAGVLILVGSQSGNASLVADLAAERLQELGLASHFADPQRDTPLILAQTSALLVCCATHGAGDVPDPIRTFYAQLLAATIDLCHVRYGMIALGDRTYAETFCGGGRRIDEALASKGAIRIGSRLEIDASRISFPDEPALAWLEDWVPVLLAATQGTATRR